MKKKILLILTFLILQTVLFSKDNNINILVLQSYNFGVLWTESVSDGIKHGFEKESNVTLYFDYLDAKINKKNNNYNQLVEIFGEKMNLIGYDMVIICDTPALNFINQEGSRIYKDIPVVFCGINNFSIVMLNKKTNIRGIAESIDHYSNIKMINEIHKDLGKILIINDKTYEGKLIEAELSQAIKKFNNKLDIELYNEYDIEELQKKVSELKKNDVIYLLLTTGDKNGKYIPDMEGINIIRKSCENPVYSAWDYYLGSGIVGGKIISGYQQGIAAAEIAKQYLLKIGNIGIMKSESKYMFDYNELKRLNIKKTELPKGSIIVNKPENLIKKYYLIVIMVFVIVVFLLMLNIAKDLFREKKLRNLLRLRNHDLIKANRKLEVMSITDSLTKLFNRGYLMVRLNEELSKAERKNKELFLIMFDIDHFKKINDKYGHQNGDIVLKKVADVFKENLRISDIAGRYGGEEFLIILQEIENNDVKIIAEKICKKIKEIDIKEIKKKITISGGVCKSVDYDIQKSIALADKLLYLAKKNGRDRIEYSIEG